jgi:glycosyltransferase involved in cell wall biosynthesis
MKILLSHPTGNANVRSVARAFRQANWLKEFYTTVAFFSGSPVLSIKEFSRRSFDDELKPFTKTWPYVEMGRMIANKLGLKSFVEHEQGRLSVDAVYRNFDSYVAKQLTSELDGVYAYEDGALATFRRAKELNIRRIYDLPIAYWETGRSLMQEEAERMPNWAITLGGGIKDSQGKLERKVEELVLADTVCVPSKFVHDSLPQWAGTKQVIMAPFGSPNSFISEEQLLQRASTNRPLRVLFVGSMGQRKGLGDLFKAINLLSDKNVELVVMGSLLTTMDFYKRESNFFTYETGRPHSEVLALMRSCDIFCLPSIVEGRALVIQEAMSQGLPIVITPNTGGEDLVIEGQTGFLVPTKSPEAIAEKIAWFLDNRDKVAEMGLNARNHAKTYSWEQYGQLIVDGLTYSK